MPILLHTPTADYGLSTEGLAGIRNVTTINAGVGLTYNINGEDTAVAGSIPAANCYSGPNFIIVAAAGAATLRLSCETGLPAHLNRSKYVTVSEVGGNNLTVVDSNGAAISGGTVINAGSCAFCYTGTTWFALEG
ncbi:hypothetical protein CMI47_17800 [Candidatus Pacearchaeota archaeon]|nr:hypothetical protein [Candidatus Pacearchaeota archaeon]|tara:strand:- start:2995 stop:3399 length:405 start_codon:yes stop_codon:yes gene_type:complete